MSAPPPHEDSDGLPVVEAVREVAEDVAERAGEVREHVVEVAEDVRERAAEVAGEVAESTGEAAAAFAQVTTHAAEVAETHPTISTGARVGFLLDGILHVAMGWAGLGIAWGWGGTADESGALTTLADTAGGRWALWIGFVGFTVVALWNLARAITGRHCRNGFKRLEHGADGLAYVTVAWSAAAFALGAGTTSRDSSVGITRTLLGLPGGTLLVVACGLAVGGVGVFSIWSGWSGDFLVDLERHPGRLAEAAGRIGFVMRGVAFGLVGYLFVAAAWTKRAEGSTGIDGALRFLQDVPLGRYELSVISVGLILFGVYLVTRARHLRR
ncbi:DUF1206 domain-containing protein [Oryzobacter terrae]|uniref:DUF1206 domain-containing protein n=1 Tax=Oryzobacter terrae TaxID=1620385 RepID=UPI0036718277